MIGQESLYRTFDDCRYKRNGLVYYGKQMPLEVAKESIKRIQELIETIQKLSP